ncbi:MAG: hypothetical protein ABEJ36_05075 [Candidatus Nanosalina sp.]
MGTSSAEVKGSATGKETFHQFPSVRHLDSEDRLEASVPDSLDEVLEEHRRYDVKTTDAGVEEFERLDEDRRAEILHRIEETAPLETDEWMEPDPEAGSIEVDWEELREEDPLHHDMYDDLEEKYREPASLFRLSLNPDDEMNWQPGDFFTLKLPETPGIDTTGHQIPELREETAEEETVFRAYSTGSSPNSDTVDLYIKRIPNDQVLEDSLTPVLDAKMQETDEVKLRGPWSDELALKEISSRDAVYIGTGTGMAPLKSMLEFSREEGLDRVGGKDVWIFLGASYRDELPGHEYFLEMDRENEHIHYGPTLSREESLSEWSGETG